MHPNLLDVLAAHPDCYFQIFTNGQLITPGIAKELRRLGNATPLISIEGSEVVSDQRRGGREVLNKTLAGLRNCVEQNLIVGVATSVCQTNYGLVSEDWLRRLIGMGVMYAWFHTYRVVGPNPAPELALTPEQVHRLRGFIVTMRRTLPIGIVDAYWDDKGEALCPMATGVSHHIGPSGAIEPCPIIQFARETIHDGGSFYKAMTGSAFLNDFRRTAAEATRGCIVLERPDLVRDLVARHAARDTTQRGTAMAELEKLTPRTSQHLPGQEVPEEHWLYRFAKKHWYFGFGAYT
jgi:MoaA/NifB/PqqE/SkfB family radical SAM enzyme